MGEWWVNEQCVAKTAPDILGAGSKAENESLVQPCCAAEPIFSCHFRDKPSKIPCTSADPIDKHGRSFW